jgi:hypothetical protein
MPADLPDKSDARREFDHLVNRARKAGILRFCHDGIAVLAVDEGPPPAPAAEQSPAMPAEERDQGGARAPDSAAPAAA